MAALGLGRVKTLFTQPWSRPACSGVSTAGLLCGAHSIQTVLGSADQCRRSGSRGSRKSARSGRIAQLVGLRLSYPHRSGPRAYNSLTGGRAKEPPEGVPVPAPPYAFGSHCEGFAAGSPGTCSTFGWQSIQFCLAAFQRLRASWPFTILKHDGAFGNVLEPGNGASESHAMTLFLQSTVLSHTRFIRPGGPPSNRYEFWPTLECENAVINLEFREHFAGLRNSMRCDPRLVVDAAV